METVTVTAQQNGTFTSIKRSRGRPKLADDGDHRGIIRGARVKVIDRFVKAVLEHFNGDRQAVARELERLLSTRADELMSDDEIIDQADREIREHEEAIARARSVRDEAVRRRDDAGRYSVDSPEVRAAVEVQADMIFMESELLARFEEFAPDDARKIAAKYPGVSWESVRSMLRKSVEEKTLRRSRVRRGLVVGAGT